MSLNQVPPPNETGGNGAGATNAGLGGLDMGMSPECECKAIFDFLEYCCYWDDFD